MKNVAVIIGLIVSAVAVACAEDTTIKGNTMELINKGEVVLFKGNVVLTRGTDVLKAKRMETSKRRDKVTATGDVQLLRQLPNGEKLKAYGEKGFFNTESGDGYLESQKKPAHVIYNQVQSATSTRVMDVYADRFDFSQTHSTGLATGQVNGDTTDPSTGDHFEFWSSSAAIDQNTQTVELYGPKVSKIHQTTSKGYRVLEGDQITIENNGKTVFAEGNAQAVFFDEVPEKEKSRGAHSAQP